MKFFLPLMLAIAPFGSLVAQERAASGPIETQVTWSALKTMVDNANAKTDALQTLVTAVKNCGNKGMLYGPSATGTVDVNGCVEVSSIPKGAVMAFNLTSCPTGWVEYVPARGRFIRGVDVTGANDPSGVRPIGSLQVDTMQNVTGQFSGNNMDPNGPFRNTGMEGTTWGGKGGGRRWWLDFDLSRSARTSNETRPKNVALLYCVAN